MPGMTLEQVKGWLRNERDRLEIVLKNLETEIIKGRDDANEPIYLTKYRVKSAESIYLKMKRKGLEEISRLKDLAGIRVICLFDTDIPKVYEYILNKLFEGYKLKNIKIFNYEEGEERDRLSTHHLLRKHVQQGFDMSQGVEILRRQSGYKSIHLLVDAHVIGKDCHVEIQLRTLLQDVWGELEHALAYKEMRVNLEIRNAFRRIQKDLDNMGARLAELKNITVRDDDFDAFIMQDSGPYSYLSYEAELKPHAFSDENVKEVINQYETLVYGGAETDLAFFARKCQGILEKLRDTKMETGQKLETYRDPKIEYWFRMEEAYCQFCLGYLDKAQEIYQEILDRHNTYPAAYVPYFRLGEIYFIKGDHIEALNLFDQADLVIGSMLSKNETNVLLENRYRIKVKMAHIYWMLGSQYIDLSLGNIEQAKDLYDQMVHKEISLKPTDRFSLLNNLCWYKLDKFLSYVGEEISARDGKSDQLFEVAWAQFDELKPVLDNHEISSNALDTAAWFCYTHFQRSGDEAWLLLSVDYAKRMLTKRNRGTMKPLVTLIHSDHVTSIASAARELGVWGLGQKSR